MADVASGVVSVDVDGPQGVQHFVQPGLERGVLGEERDTEVEAGGDPERCMGPPVGATVGTEVVRTDDDEVTMIGEQPRTEDVVHQPLRDEVDADVLGGLVLRRRHLDDRRHAVPTDSVEAPAEPIQHRARAGDVRVEELLDEGVLGGTEPLPRLVVDHGHHGRTWSQPAGASRCIRRQGPIPEPPCGCFVLGHDQPLLDVVCHPASPGRGAHHIGGIAATRSPFNTQIACYAYEPWHFRYVGRARAKAVRDSGPHRRGRLIGG